MRLFVAVVIAVTLGVSVPAHAQTYLITASGTYTSGDGDYASLPSGTPFTFSETFHVATATLTSESNTTATYADPSGTSSFSFDGLTISGIDPQVQVISDFIAGSTPYYGYNFIQPLSNNGQYSVQVVSPSSSLAPSLALTSLSGVGTPPPSEYNNNLNIASYYDGSSSIFSGTTTSFSVQIETVPEPASAALAVLAVPLFLWLRSRHQREVRRVQA